jgi:hypothetical protein
MNKTIFRVLLLISMLASLLLTAAVPLPASPAAVKEKPDSVRLTIDNRNTKAIIVRLAGPAYYWFTVAGYDSGVFVVKRGTYTMTLTACGVSATTTLNMNSQMKLVMPICGGNAKAAARSGASKVIDLSTIIKIVGISIANKATTDMLVIFSGPATYVFSVKKGDTMDYTVKQGSYAVTYYACGTIGKRNSEFNANWDKVLKLYCP